MMIRKSIQYYYLFFLVLVPTMFLPQLSCAQETQGAKAIEVQMADLRGRGYEAAGQAAFKASLNDVVIVLLCGADQAIIDATKTELNILIHEKYPRVAMILSDEVGVSDEQHPIVAIIVKNENTSYMTGVDAHLEYRRDLRRSVRAAYENYILAHVSE